MMTEPAFRGVVPLDTSEYCGAIMLIPHSTYRGTGDSFVKEADLV